MLKYSDRDLINLNSIMPVIFIINSYHRDLLFMVHSFFYFPKQGYFIHVFNL